MDLISREAALEAVKIPNGEYPNPSERHGIIIARVEARRRIREIPSAPAVPLDKLCEWLAEHANYIQKEDFGGTIRSTLEACHWKCVLRKWMEEQRDD